MAVTDLAANGGTPISPQHVPINRITLDASEIQAVADVLASGNLREGQLCRAFEEEFAAHVGAGHAVSVSSGTAALHVAYAALLEAGDEVIVPSFTFIATASMVAAGGARPVFCDVDPDTFTLDVADAARRVTSRTAAIAPVHLFGNPCDVGGVKQLASEHGLRIVWDAAQAHGARYDGADIGGHDDAVCYSFYPSKNMTTAEGGMITTNDSALAEKCRLLRSHGQSGKYHHTLLGFNYRLTDVMAALGRHQLTKLDGWVARRRANARVLMERLGGIHGLKLPRSTAGSESSYNLFSILVNATEFGIDRDEFVRLMQAENIGVTVNYPKGLHQQPIFAEGADSLPVTEELSQNICSLPCHAELDEEAIGLVASAVEKVAASTG